MLTPKWGRLGLGTLNEARLCIQDVLLSVEVHSPSSFIGGGSVDNVVPALGDIVTAKVLSVNPR